MFKKLIFLVVLTLLLVALVFLKDQTAAPVNQTIAINNDSSEYTMLEYKITNIEGNQYFGESDNGTEIHFSDKSIVSTDNIEIHDKVICYFEKNNLGKGLVKVEKK